MTIINERSKLQRQAERGEINPAEYWNELKRTWALMSKVERVTERASATLGSDNQMTPTTTTFVIA